METTPCPATPDPPAAGPTPFPAERSRMNLVTGSAVCGLLALLGILMVLHAGRKLKKLH